MCRKMRKTTPCSSVEVLLITVTLVLFVVCVGLAVVSWLALQTGNEAQAGSSNSSFSGTLTISEGASFTEELRNRSSVQFKALAFDTELLVTEAYALGSLGPKLRSCRVTDFSPGSVIVHFTVLFGDVVEVTVVQEQLISGLQNIPDATLVINSSSVQVTDISTTQAPPTTTPTPTAVPADCGGPFDLYESNSTFSSPNYPLSYGHNASCLWILHANPGQNIQLHFRDFSLEATYDVVEVRDGVEPNSTLLNVLTGAERKFPDLYSTSSEMMVMFFSDASGKDRGFLANFSTGFNLGQPEPCKAGEYRCRSGVCVSNTSVCDGVSNCPDASDEAQCVHLTTADSPRLKVEIQSRLYTACSSDWSSHFSLYYCRYLGYRSGNASFVSVVAEDAPFIVVTQAADGAVDVKPSETCPSDEAVSLHCNNQPCGKRKVVINTESRVETEEGTSEGVDGRIAGGEDAVKGAWPWIASLRFTGIHICGATIIDSQWLVTAAHCVYGKNIHLANWNVVLGLHAQYESNTSDRQHHNVDQIVMNQNYNKRTKDSDIALMHLQDKITFTDYIQPICLPDPNQQFEAERKCFIAGWGEITEGVGNPADVLQQAVVPLINNSVCQERLPEYKITEQMVCAGYPEGGIDSCKGDSGGPLMCEEEDASWVLAGVTSFGRGCARPGRPGVYVLVPKFIDWILETRRLYTQWNGTR